MGDAIWTSVGEDKVHGQPQKLLSQSLPIWSLTPNGVTQAWRRGRSSWGVHSAAAVPYLQDLISDDDDPGCHGIMAILRREGAALCSHGLERPALPSHPPNAPADPEGPLHGHLQSGPPSSRDDTQASPGQRHLQPNIRALTRMLRRHECECLREQRNDPKERDRV